MDIDDQPFSLGSSPSGAVEPREVFGQAVLESALRLAEGDADEGADQDDLDTWWAFIAGRSESAKR